MVFSLPHISRIISAGAIGFIFGVAILSFFEVSIDAMSISIIFLVVILGFVFFASKKIWLVIIFLLFIVLGAQVMHVVNQKNIVIAQNVGVTLDGNASIIADVVHKDWYDRLIAKYDDGVTVLLKDVKYTEVVRGDILKLHCVSSLPENFEDFDYRKYLAMKGVDYVCEEFEYEIVGHNKTFFGTLSNVRRYLENIVSGIIPAPQSALANGLLFGGDDMLSEQLQQKFAVTGMTHIVAVSGYNVSVIVISVMAFAIFIGFSRRYAVFVAIGSIILFIALIGFPSSGVRAAIMGVMVLVATLYGRVSHMYGAIFVTAAIMIFFNPLLLRYDIGFQLSFLATIGIVAIYPILETFFSKRKTQIGVVEIFLMTISAQLFVLPIIIYNFHLFSVVSILVNLLVLPILPITMLLVFLLIISSFIFYPLAVFFGWGAYFLLSYEIMIIDFFAQLRWSSFEINDISYLWFIGYYIMLIGIIFIDSNYRRNEI